MTSRSDRNVLPYRQKVDLALLVQAEFAKFGGTDGAFAEFASEKLGFPVNANHVGACRKAYGIETVSGPGTGTAMREIAALRRRIEVLEKRFDVWDSGATK